jgi:hypothetical protein
MKISNSAKYVVGVSAAVALLIGCSGGSQLSPSGSTNQLSAIRSGVDGNHGVDLASMLVTRPGIVIKQQKVYAHPIKRNCCAHEKTLFVSDASGGPSGTGAVQMYSYPAGKYIGQIAAPPEGFRSPQGECTDKIGDVFIANSGATTIDEYSHGGTFIQALTDSGEYPAGCSYDRSTGNLAVSNMETVPFGGQGGLSIYTGATGDPAVYTDSASHIYHAYFLGYDNKGLLWVDGESISSGFAYASFSGGTFTAVTITGGPPGTPAFPGFVQWSRKTKSMNVGDQSGPALGTPTLYLVSATGAVTGSTTLTCPASACDIAQAYIKGPRIVGPNALGANADIYPYPAGGSAESVVTANLVAPIGSAVSPDVP